MVLMSLTGITHDLVMLPEKGDVTWTCDKYNAGIVVLQNCIDCLCAAPFLYRGVSR